MPSGLINTRILVAAGACLAALLGSFALSRPNSEADSGGGDRLPPARVVRAVEPEPLPKLGEASKLPALGRKARPSKARRRPAPAIVAPAPEPPPDEPVKVEEPVVPVAPAPVAPAPVTPAPTPVAPSPPEPAPAEPTPEPPPVYFDDSG